MSKTAFVLGFITWWRGKKRSTGSGQLARHNIIMFLNGDLMMNIVTLHPHSIISSPLTITMHHVTSYNTTAFLETEHESLWIRAIFITSKLNFE